MCYNRLIFFIFLFFLFASCGEALAAAAPAGKGATAWRGRYDAAVADFTALAKDEKRGGLREGWEKLAARFAALQKEAKSKSAAAKADFYEARSLEELARRSWNANDFRKAEKALAAMAKAYPNDPLAAEAKQRMADMRTSGPDASPDRQVAAKPAAQPEANTSARAEKPDPKAAAALYRDAAEDWRALLRDSRKGMQRDPWLDLERRFLAALAKDPEGATGAKARFQAARCREELAERSHLRSDWQHAVTQYLTLAADFASSDLADDGLFRAAFIMAKRLDDADGAREAAGQVLKRYPRGDMAASARELAASLPPEPPAVKKAETAPPKKPGPFVQLSQLRRVSWQGDNKRMVVFLELDRPAAFSHQCLGPGAKGSPARLQIDLADTRPASDLKPGLTLTGKLIPRVRVALMGAEEKSENGKTRVVLDLGRLRHYTVTTRLSPPGISVQASAANLADGLAPPPAGKNGPVLQGRFSGDESDEGGKAGTLMEQLGLTVRTIMLDPGHGGKDPGAMGNGIRESSVTLQLAKMLGERLRKAGFIVLYTREKDVYVALEQRTEMANKKKADLFISLHVNASTDKNLNGLETYFLDLARTSSAATVAARENAVSVKSISDLQFILTDLMLSAKLQESRELSRIMQGSMHGRAQRAGFGVANNGVRSAPFYVLMGARMPAALVEIGYLSNAADAKRIQSDTYLERLADGLAAGVAAYKQKLAKFAGR